MGVGIELKLGVLGGTFDPIHIGHLTVAEVAKEQMGLDEVIFVPAGKPWLKEGHEISDAHHRMTMVELAIARTPCFRASDIEIRRPGPTYTADTLRELHDQMGHSARIYFIVGLDSLATFGRWRTPAKIFDMARVVCVSRPGFQDFDLRTLDSLVPGASSKVTLLKGPMIGISGNHLRQSVAEGLSIKHQVPEAVATYIHDHELYTHRSMSEGGAGEQVRS